MPKMKNHSGAKKRFRKSGGGKWRHQKAGRRHLLAPLSSNKRHSLRSKNTLTDTEGKTMERWLPYA